MPTSLGGPAHAGFRLMVRNKSGATIKKGITVSWNGAVPSVAFLDLAEAKDFGSGNEAQRIPYFEVDPAPADSTTDGGAGRLGVVMSDILDEGYGEVMVYGFAECIANGADIVAGDVVTVDAAGEVIDAANASHSNPMGIGLETSVADELVWCFVDFIGASAGAGTAFHGRAY